MDFEGFVQISSPRLQLSPFLTLDKLLTFYEPQFPYKVLLSSWGGYRSLALSRLTVRQNQVSVMLVLLEVLQSLHLRSGDSHSAILLRLQLQILCILANSPTILYLLNH